MLQQRPTRLQELVPLTPSFHGACDACQRGMGGVWFASDPADAPLLWRARFPRTVRDAMITFTNPASLLSISNIEVAAFIAHKDILAVHTILAERTIWMTTDNRAALSWSSTPISARAH